MPSESRPGYAIFLNRPSVRMLAQAVTFTFQPGSKPLGTQNSASSSPASSPDSHRTGVVISLRELAWRSQKTPDAGVSARIAAIHWILTQTDAGKSALPEKTDNLAELRTTADRLAIDAAKTRWTASSTRTQIEQLCKNAALFRDATQDATILRRRAEVIVSSVRALALPLRREKDVKVEEQLRSLEDQLRSPVSFTPATFAGLLEALPALLP